MDSHLVIIVCASFPIGNGSAMDQSGFNCSSKNSNSIQCLGSFINADKLWRHVRIKFVDCLQLAGHMANEKQAARLADLQDLRTVHEVSAKQSLLAVCW
ncbi:MAG: hypothetical protein EOO65_05105 [Methanosarcinales archaeon]|nr:MAG: hypothetical protein EOO65_05105 [Methanosarcinales archaeon]